MIVSQYTIYEMNHKHMIHKNRKSMKHCCSWTTYKHEHELNFDHDQKSHHKTWCEYEDFEISNVVKKYKFHATEVTYLDLIVFCNDIKKKINDCFLIHDSQNESRTHNSQRQEEHEALLLMNNIQTWTQTQFWSWSKITS